MRVALVNGSVTVIACKCMRVQEVHQPISTQTNVMILYCCHQMLRLLYKEWRYLNMNRLPTRREEPGPPPCRDDRQCWKCVTRARRQSRPHFEVVALPRCNLSRSCFSKPTEEAITTDPCHSHTKPSPDATQPAEPNPRHSRPRALSLTSRWPHRKRSAAIHRSK